MKHRYLTKNELLIIHNKVVKETGENSGILFPGNIDLCIESPQLTIFGTEVHKTLDEKAACLVYEILKLHPFIDGNKRTGFIAMDVFLRLNGYKLVVDKNEAVQVSLKTSDCLMHVKEISKWIRDNVHRIYRE